MPLYPGAGLDLRERQAASEGRPPFFPLALDRGDVAETNILPMREVAMMLLMDSLTDKDEWERKIFDEQIVEKWKKEAFEQSEDAIFARVMEGKADPKIPKPKVRIISEKAFDFCIAELRNKAEYAAKTGLVPTLDSAGHTVVKTDRIVSSDLHENLRNALDELRVAQGSDPDWHPKTNEMVQDLVHPSLYPLVYGRSHFLQDESEDLEASMAQVGEGNPLPPDNAPTGMPEVSPWGHSFETIPPGYWSNKFQWLPANVSLSPDTSVKFTSYVNNLHPKKFSNAYGALEQLINSVMPAWNQCLRLCESWDAVSSAGRSESRFEQIWKASDSDKNLWTPRFHTKDWKDADVPLSRRDYALLERRAGGDVDLREDEQNERDGKPLLTPELDESEDKERLIAKAKWKNCRDAVLPEPGEFHTIDYSPKLALQEKFAYSGLQVIVKIASIELTPDKPEFGGGGWHIEGQMNEKICATALYYIECENVTTSRLSFRMQTNQRLNETIEVAQDRYNYLERVYGTPLGPVDGENGACLQTFGDVETREGRVVAFPNTLQHRVSPFRLKDATKPGRRSFVALWLVDPHQRIISTANVPPQQRDWWEEGGASSQQGSTSPNPPASIMDKDEALGYRLELMEERTAFQDNTKGVWENLLYSFCEH